MWPPPLIILLPLLLFASHIQGGCDFPAQWQGRWFQSGFGLLHVNRSSIETKGECVESYGDKFMVHDKSEDCYRCMVIHEKHAAVLQYKETYCDQRASLQELCYGITGDAPLYSMFRGAPDAAPVACPFKAAPFTFSYNRGSGECSNPPSRAESCADDSRLVLKYQSTSHSDAPLYSMFRGAPDAAPVACPFKAAPFTFSYNRGSGECSNPPSRAESCTDDSRLVLKYQACPDIQSTESNVEELVCVATWKEGSTRYLVGRLTQHTRHSLSDEDSYRCFIYERVSVGPRVVYHVAQSGDATCNGLQSAVEGSRTMRLTTADTHHGRCRFPNFVTDHHTWLSLDHSQMFKFSTRNATLWIGRANTQATSSHHPAPPTDAQFDSEVRVVCHSILQSIESKRVQIVAHITRGCESGYTCMLFHKRDTSVIEIQQPRGLHDNTDDACRYFDPHTTPFTTLIAPNLHALRCPHPGSEFLSFVLVVCHSILQSIESKRVQIVAHITRGCESGYTCMLFHKRDTSVIEIQQPRGLHDNTDDACRYFDPHTTPFTTLIAPNLHALRCPHPGRYTVVGSEPSFEVRKRKKRQDAPGPSAGGPAGAPGPENEVAGAPPQPECLWHDYEALNVGCGNSGNDVLEFKASCQHQPISAYTCHGSWQENHTHFLIASPISRKSTDALRYCLVYTLDHETTPAGGAQSPQPASQLSAGGEPPGGPAGATPPADTVMRLSGLVHTCDRLVRPGKDGVWRFNFTTNGGCSRVGDTSRAPSTGASPLTLLLLSTIPTLLLHLVTLRPVR